MAIVRWNDPFREFAQLQERINRVFNDAYRSDEGLMTSGTWVPPVDIYQNGDHEVVIKAEFPDMSREDIDITVDNGTLTIKGEKRQETEEKKENYYTSERRYGAFERSFQAPEDIDETKIEASFSKGLLTVTLPKRAEAQKLAKTIAVKGA